jgi:hypothetical protein
MSKLARLLTGSFVVFIIPTIASADVVFNGGFETGDFTGWILSGNPIPGKVDTTNPHSGSFAADLNALGSQSFMAQPLTTTPGAMYNLAYFLDISPDSTGGPVEFLAQINGVTVFDQTNIPPQPYTRYSFAFVATGASTEIKFGFRNDPGAFFLDDVSVTAVPEPSSIWLGLLVIAFAIVALRRQPPSAEPQS